MWGRVILLDAKVVRMHNPYPAIFQKENKKCEISFSSSPCWKMKVCEDDQMKYVHINITTYSLWKLVSPQLLTSTFSLQVIVSLHTVIWNYSLKWL